MNPADSTTPPSSPDRAAEHFADGPLLRVSALGRGLINDTFLAATASRRFVLQRINHRVFPDPAAIIANLRILLDHVRQGHPNSAARDIRFPDIVPTRSGADCHVDGDGGFWRALSFIDNTRNQSRLEGPAQAAEVGYALGRFHALVSTLDSRRMQDTLPGFHVAPVYLARFDAAAARSRRTPDSSELRWAMDFIEQRRPFIDVLERAKRNGTLRTRIIHGDPKVDNVLFDRQTGAAVALIDLDTVKPGLIHYDLGDCLRSCCNRGGETADDGDARFDLDICRAILGAYLAETRAFLTPADRAYLYDAIRLLPLELGLRFLTDHLEGDAYFKVDAPGRNLQRAAVQFRLTESVERQERAMRNLIAELG